LFTKAILMNKLNMPKNKYKIVPEYEHKEDVYSYSMAQIRFKEGKYDEVLIILNQTVFSDMYTKMDVRRMCMKLYYAPEYIQLFEDMVNSFRSFLSENENNIPAEHIQANRDFTNICNRIHDTLRRDKKRIKSIEEKIANIQVLPEKTWLLEKLNALK